MKVTANIWQATYALLEIHNRVHSTSKAARVLQCVTGLSRNSMMSELREQGYDELDDTECTVVYTFAKIFSALSISFSM
jgi:hypothetical protein